MKLKESYTLEELCSGLSITFKKFCQMAGITEGTLINLRQGHAGRPSTVNSILEAFSKVYGIELDLSNVSGLTLQEKPHQKGKKPPVSTPTIDAISQPASPQKSIVEPKRVHGPQKNPKKSDLPEGCILYSDFAKSHGLPPTTFRDHMLEGLGPGLIDMSTDTIPERDRVHYEERVKPNRPKEKERYLTPEQQAAAIAFWKRHDVSFTECDKDACPCHISQ